MSLLSLCLGVVEGNTASLVPRLPLRLRVFDRRSPQPAGALAFGARKLRCRRELEPTSALGKFVLMSRPLAPISCRKTRVAELRRDGWMSAMTLFDTAQTPTETVSELTRRVKSRLETEFGRVAVRGEVTNVSRPRSGHIYFTLKDEAASLQAVIWRSEAARLRFDLKDGLAVRVFGRLTVYELRGHHQVVVNVIEPEGVGALELAFRQLVARLGAEGLFDAGRKRIPPRFPRRIVVVTSPTGAAIRDFLQVLGRRWRSTEVLIVPTRVQGLGAAAEIARAIGLANRVSGADLIVLARGGGSLEDLWAFNEEETARAIVASRLPVVTGVGHEVDVTIADLCADLRALTPSEAAERVVPDAREVEQHLDQLSERLGQAVERRLESARMRVEHAAERLPRAVRGGIERSRMRVEIAGERLPRALQARLQNARSRLERDSERLPRGVAAVLASKRSMLARLAAGLDALSPLAVLARGYSITLRERDDAIVRSSSDVEVGERVVSRLKAGSLVSRVERRER